MDQKAGKGQLQAVELINDLFNKLDAARAPELFIQKENLLIVADRLDKLNAQMFADMKISKKLTKKYDDLAVEVAADLKYFKDLMRNSVFGQSETIVLLERIAQAGIQIDGFKYELNECLERGKAYITSMAAVRGAFEEILRELPLSPAQVEGILNAHGIIPKFLSHFI